MAAIALRVQLPKAHWHVANPPAVVSHPRASSSAGAKCNCVTTFACFCARTPATSVCCTSWASSRGRARACVIATRTMQITLTRTKCECFIHPLLRFVMPMLFHSRCPHRPDMRCGGARSMTCARGGAWCATNNGAARSRLFETRCILNNLRFVRRESLGYHAA